MPWCVTHLWMAIGENVPALASEGDKAKFKAGVLSILRCAHARRHPLVVVRSCFWADAAKDEMLQKASQEADAIFVDAGPLGREAANAARAKRTIAHDGVAGHPGDRGMKALADAIVQAVLQRRTPAPASPRRTPAPKANSRAVSRQSASAWERQSPAPPVAADVSPRPLSGASLKRTDAPTDVGGDARSVAGDGASRRCWSSETGPPSPVTCRCSRASGCRTSPANAWPW